MTHSWKTKINNNFKKLLLTATKRFTGKILIENIVKAGEDMLPLRFGVKIPGGCEMVLHIISNTSYETDPTKAT